MKKRNKTLLGILTTGAVALSGAVCALREKPLEEGWRKCELYAESPSYPRFLQENIFDKIPAGLDDTMKHPESDRVKCLDLRNPGEETWNNYCIFRLTNKNESKQGLIANLTEEFISQDVYKFSGLDIKGFEKNPQRLRDIIDNVPWIPEAVESGGYVVWNIRKNGRIIERHYELGNGRRVVAVDSNEDGILDRYREF